MDDDRHFLIAIGKEVRGWRNTRGLTIAQLAEKAGVGKATVERLENASTAASVTVTWAVADALGVPLSTLVRRAEETAAIMRGTGPRNEGLPGDERERMWEAIDADYSDDLARRRSEKTSEATPSVSEKAVAKRRKDRGENEDDQ